MSSHLKPFDRLEGLIKARPISKTESKKKEETVAFTDTLPAGVLRLARPGGRARQEKETVDHYTAPTLKRPRSITRLKRESSTMRRSLIERYRRAYPEDSPYPGDYPPGSYLNETDIIASHILRSEAELKGPHSPTNGPGGEEAHGYSRAMLKDYPLTGGGNTLCEICIGVIGERLKTRAKLGVAAGFFSSAVGCIDDYLDREGDYDRYGKRLYWASHAYRDLQDLALDEEVRSGRLTAGELGEIKRRLYEVILTLVESERTLEPDSYLYRKSCGDKVIAVLFPTTGADEPVKSRCAEIGRLVGEAGQLIDDAMDYEIDLERNNPNYMLMSGTSVADGLDGAGRRLRSAKEASAWLGPSPILWLLDTMEGLVGIFREQLKSGARLGPDILKLSKPLASMLPDGIPANQFLLWF